MGREKTRGARKRETREGESSLACQSRVRVARAPNIFHARASQATKILGSLSNDGGNENVTFISFVLLPIISTRSTSTETVNYPATQLVGVALKLRKKMKNSPSCAHVLQKT